MFSSHVPPAPVGEEFDWFAHCEREAAGVEEIDDFKDWIRHCVRPLIPHGALACAHGRLHAWGISLDYLVTVDYPTSYLETLRNPWGHMDTPLARWWYERGTSIFFDADHPPADTPAPWLEHFRQHGLRNTAVDGVLDKENSIATYFSFHRLPTLDEVALRSTFKKLTPLLHRTFARVIHRYTEKTTPLAFKCSTLTSREQDIATYISKGKSNSDIALLLNMSENTVRNYVSRIFDKTGCKNRAGLAAAVVLQEQLRFQIGTKVL